jgi:hypothetical protein
MSTNKKVGTVVHACHPNYKGPDQLGNKDEILFKKITEAKRAEGTNKIVEHLPSKHKALS